MESSTPVYSSVSSDAAAPAYSYVATAMPAPASPSTVAAGSGAANETASGSIDTCGSNGGLTCETGMCCSSHG